MGTKLRQRFLNPKVHLPMGNMFVDIAHLKQILEKFPKCEHGLTNNDLNPNDKMNFRSVEKMTDERVLKLLEADIENRATLQYLKITKYCTEAFLSTSLSMRTRIYYMWYSVMFLRIWRVWLPTPKVYSTKLNFITSQTHACIEINAHGLLTAALKNTTGNALLPWLMSSQGCESLFRELRSMTSTFSTVVNMSILDMMKRLKRLQIIHSAADNLSEFEFARHDKKSVSNIENLALTLPEIVKIVMDAKETALIDAVQMGMYVDQDFDQKCFVSFKDMNEKDEEESEDEETETAEIQNAPVVEPMESAEEILNIDEETLQSIKSLNLKNYEELPVGQQSDIVSLKFKEKTYNIKKSTLIWMLSKESQRVSSDRLFRFKT